MLHRALFYGLNYRASSSSHPWKRFADETRGYIRPVSEIVYPLVIALISVLRLRGLNDKYGPLASLKVGTGTMIVVGGDGSLVGQLLDKRGAIYSNRPLQMATEIAGAGDSLL
jgi:hypothetical protein